MIQKFLIILILLIPFIGFSQEENKEECECKDGRFYMKIQKGKLELIPGVYRSRVGSLGSPFQLKNQNITMNIFFPFSNILEKRVDKKKLMEMNIVSFIHFSNEGNYGVGFGSKTRWLITKNVFASYQGGIGWFDTNDKNARDGLVYRGFNFHHIFSLIYPVSPKIDLSMNFLHVSNGGILGENEESNVQDVMGIGLAYQF